MKIIYILKFEIYSLWTLGKDIIWIESQRGIVQKRDLCKTQGHLLQLETFPMALRALIYHGRIRMAQLSIYYIYVFPEYSAKRKWIYYINIGLINYSCGVYRVPFLEPILRHAHVHSSSHIYTYTYIYIPCVCVIQCCNLLPLNQS